MSKISSAQHSRRPPTRQGHCGKGAPFRPEPCILDAGDLSRPAGLARTLSAELVFLMLSERGVEGVVTNPDPFTWTDGLTGRPQFHAPLALVKRSDGSRTYVDARFRKQLVHDPELGERRRRIELECSARGARHEVWTEAEIREDRNLPQLLRTADFDERVGYTSRLRAVGAHGQTEHGVVHELSTRMGLADLVSVGDGFVARSMLTGIPMALLCDLHVDPETRMAVWKPRPGRHRMDGTPVAAPSDKPGPLTSAKATSPELEGCDR